MAVDIYEQVSYLTKKIRESDEILEHISEDKFRINLQNFALSYEHLVKRITIVASIIHPNEIEEKAYNEQIDELDRLHEHVKFVLSKLKNKARSEQAIAGN
jgi:hypothetical protein